MMLTVNGYKLDKDQIEVIKNNNSNLLVIAGAGAGKTLTIIAKIKYLIEINHMDPKEILCISFTNEATNSLRKKLNNNYDIDIKTFHKLALDIIKSNNSHFNIVPSNYLKDIIDYFFNYSIYKYDTLIKIVLKYFNIHFTKKNFIKKYQKVLFDNNLNKLKKTIFIFINLFKGNNNKKNLFKEFLNNSVKKETYFLLITYTIYLIYEEELNNLKMLDFNDMINRAINLVKNSSLKYKYIIVDEYQDTSKSRYRLLKEIVYYTHSKLMVVGDDFQSIYRFSGCSLEIFLNFNKYFKNSKILYLKHTYRNSQELINVAGNFIMQNPKQIKKDLHAFKHLNKPLLLYYYKNIKKDFTDLLYTIASKGSVLILGRNNFDIYKVLDLNTFKMNKDGYLIFKDNMNLNIRFLTIHKAKGLESNNVIIINLEDNLYGFPNKVVDESVLRFVNKTQNYILYEEERRLFYVALTRSKNYVYLYVNKRNESIFIKELKRRYANYLKIIKK